MGKVQLIVTPLALHKVGRQHKDRPVALLNARNDVLHNALAGDKVSLVLAQLYTTLTLLQVRDQLVLHPQRIALAVGNERVKLQNGLLLFRVVVPSSTLRLRPLPRHAHVPRHIQVDAQKGHDSHQHQRQQQSCHKQEHRVASQFTQVE
ncbi:hypothetical protein N312_00033, partial [Balearica regulorum gibbericeps]